MRMAPARDLMFSQRAWGSEPRAAFLPRAFATTFAAMTTIGGKSEATSEILPRSDDRQGFFRVLPDAARGRADESARPLTGSRLIANYFRCLLTSLVISNIETLDLPPNTGFRFSSALIWRRFLASWRPFRLMYAQSFFVTSVRGSGAVPTTVPSCALGVIGFMNAAFGTRLAPLFFAVFFVAAFLAPPFFAADFFAGAFFADAFFAAPFFAADFFAAMLVSWDNEQVLAMSETLYDGAQDTMPHGSRNREIE